MRSSSYDSGKRAGTTQRLISGWAEGDCDARDALVARLLPELEQIASARLRKENGSSFSSHDLVNEAVERIMKRDGAGLVDRAHFLALSSRLMRNILVDHARAKNRDKRSHHRVELNTEVEGARRVDLEALETALVRLGSIDPELMEIVEMRFYGGMKVLEIAEATRWSEPTVKRRWQVARAWLADALVHPIGND